MLHDQYRCCGPFSPSAADPKRNPSVRWIPRTSGRGGRLRAALRADAGARCEDLTPQLDSRRLLDSMQRRIIHSLRSRPGTAGAVDDTWDSVEERSDSTSP